jgi:hypothetical protein
MKLFQSNIAFGGRAFRAFGGVIFILAALATRPYSRVGAAILAVTALIMFFEAGRGWCIARACGFKTPL